MKKIARSHKRQLAEAPLVAAHLGCATAFRRIALDCLANVKAHHGGACAGEADAVHQMRVAITRLRAAVAFFAPMTDDAVWTRLKREIAWLNAALGAVRDSDVVMDYAQRKRYRSWARRAGRQDLDQRSLRDHHRLVRALHSQRYQRLMKAAANWIESGPWSVRSDKLAARRRAEQLTGYGERKLKRWYGRLVRKGSRLAKMTASRRHRLRIRVKRYRYMLEALRGVFPKPDRARIRRTQKPARRLQRALGDLRDLKRFGRVGTVSLQPAGGRRNVGRPPHYRKQTRKLLAEALAAHRGLKRAKAS